MFTAINDEDEVVIYPFTRRRMLFVYFSFAWVILGAVVVASVSPQWRPALWAIIPFFGGGLLLMAGAISLLRRRLRRIQTAGCETTAVVCRKERMRTTNGPITQLLVEFTANGEFVSRLKAVHPLVWEACEVGDRIAIRYDEKAPWRWVPLYRPQLKAKPDASW
jgi:hypothetical protein